MHLDLSADDVLTTTRSVRKRLDFDRPVEREVVDECIAVAAQAPTGSNAQGFHFMVVTEDESKALIAEHYGRNFDMFYGDGAGDSPYGDDDARTDRHEAVIDSATYLRQRLHEVPVMVIPCIEGRLVGEQPTVMTASFWGSILPAMWSFMLAARERGLGSAWTTLHLVNEVEVAEHLGIPHESVTQAGLLPLAYTRGTDFKVASRVGLDERTHWDRW